MLHSPLWAALLTAVVLCGALAAASSAYLLLLLAAAASARRRLAQSAPSPEPAPRAVVIVPAHNEELVLAATLSSLKAQQYPADRYEVVVIADNCTDATAQIARDAGVSVLERQDRERRGKGFALEWAIDRLLQRDRTDADPVLAFVLVDADTKAHPQFLARLTARLFSDAGNSRRTHSRALQGRYGVLNVSDSWRAALMTAAFDLVNHVKPLGRDRLGMSVGLKGNGMGFTRAVLERAPWPGRSITEDIDYGLDLLLHHGLPVGYAPDALVQAQMPVTAAQATSQRERWEGGRYRLLRERALPLLRAGLRRRDLRLLDAGIDLMIPPLAELAALHLLWFLLAGAAALLSQGSLALWLLAPALSLCGYTLYILGGLRVADAPAAAYTALLRAPLYAPWKFALYASRLVQRRIRRTSNPTTGGGEWVRTERTPMHAETKRP